MRKYWRLSLILVAVLSCTFMLVYRQKYYNLNSVLEIMNIFKCRAERNPNLCKIANQSTSLNHSSLFIEEMLNSHRWIEISRGMYTYSSYFIPNKVITLGYAYVSARELENISCRLWYENHTDSIKSSVKIFLLNKQTPTLFYMSCIPPFDYDIPYAVTFVKDNSSSSLPIFYRQLHTGSYAACVKPLSSIYVDTYKMLEFIIYHSHIGIKHFIFYYTAISSSVKKLLVDIATECGIYIELVPWIVPFSFESSKFKLKPDVIDCIFHVSSLNHSSFLFLLDLDNFIFLEENSNMDKLIHDNSPFDFLQLQKQVFCSEFPNNIFAQDLNIHFRTLLKTKIQPERIEKVNAIYNVSRVKSIIEQNGGFKKWLFTTNVQKYKIINKSSGVIFSYAQCGINSNNEKSIYTEDNRMWKFKDVFYKSCSYLLSKKAVIIED